MKSFLHSRVAVVTSTLVAIIACMVVVEAQRAPVGPKADISVAADLEVIQLRPNFFMITKTFRYSPQAISPVGPACVAVFEGTTPGASVSHYAPEKNPFVDEMTKRFGVPRAAALGEPETLYPEYRKKIKATSARLAP